MSAHKSLQRLILALGREPQYDGEDDRAEQARERHDELGARDVEKRGQTAHRGKGVGCIGAEDFAGLLESSNQAEEGQEESNGDKQCRHLTPHPGFETEIFAVEEDDRPYRVAQDPRGRHRR